jgi:SAM-dependent methyltransferase
MQKRGFKIRWGISIGLMAALVAGAQQSQRPADVPYIPTSEAVVAAMLKLAEVKNGDLVYDLGCGDGRIVIAAAKNFGARGVGIDIDPDRIREANENAHKAGVENHVRFLERDLFTADIRDADVVTLYLLNRVNLKLRSKLLQELRPGTRVVSNTFDMGDWKPDKEVMVDGRRVMLWRVPERN